MDGFMRVLNYHPLDGGELNRYLWFFIKMPKEIAGLEELGLEIEHAVSACRDGPATCTSHGNAGLQGSLFLGLSVVPFVLLLAAAVQSGIYFVCKRMRFHRMTEPYFMLLKWLPKAPPLLSAPLHRRFGPDPS